MDTKSGWKILRKETAWKTYGKCENKFRMDGKEIGWIHLTSG
jgi:hypothetical protein